MAESWIRLTAVSIFFITLQKTKLKVNMIATIVVLTIVLILAILIIPFARQMVKDKLELERNPINKKFEVLVGIINDAMLDGKGEITLFDDDPKMMNLMSDDKRNMLIQFYYSTGNLTIYLIYKFLQKELKWNKLFGGLRNISIYMQKDIANDFIENANKRIMEFQESVGYEDVQNMSGSHYAFHSESDPTSMISDMYSSLPLTQKRSMVNFLYIIGKSSGAEERKILSCPGLSQTILSLNVKWDDCKKQLSDYGENKIYIDLQNIEDIIVTMMIMSALQIVGTLSSPSSPNPQMEDKFISSFEKIGYSEQQIEEHVEKMVAMNKMFGL